MNSRLRLIAAGAFAFSFSLLSLAESTVFVAESRVRLRDIVPTVAPGIAGFDLGASPPPGRNLFLSRDAIAERLRAGGISANSLALPEAGVRIQTESRSYGPDELERIARPAIERALPPGVVLRKVSVREAQNLSTSLGVGGVRVPSFVFRKGEQTQMASVELLWGSESLVRLPVEIKVELSEELLATKVARGTTVTLAIRRGQVEITALGETLGSARIGEPVQIRVGVTKKVLTATLVGTDRAEISVKP